MNSEWCCVAFKGAFANAGERGFAIFVAPFSTDTHSSYNIARLNLTTSDRTTIHDPSRSSPKCTFISVPVRALTQQFYRRDSPQWSGLD